MEASGGSSLPHVYFLAHRAKWLGARSLQDYRRARRQAEYDLELIETVTELTDLVGQLLASPDQRREDDVDVELMQAE